MASNAKSPFFCGTQYLLSVIDGKFQIPSAFPVRFLEKIVIDPETKCWNWIGATGFHPKYRHHRYGQIVIWKPANGKRRMITTAHRFAYQCANGPIADNLDVDHLCGNKLCCNPSHLEAVTHQENARRRGKPFAKEAAI